jgi:hypothetical protein
MTSRKNQTALLTSIWAVCGMRRMEASCAPTSYLGAHSRAGGFHAQAVALNCVYYV